jgi:hypothetical protein
MFTPDIAQLVRSALHESGCDPRLFSTLDNQSTITLELRDLPATCISQQGDNVWLWADLMEYNEVLLQQLSPQFLPALMREAHFACSGQLQLAVNEGQLVLKALVHAEYLTGSQSFSQALNDFFERLGLFCKVVR